MSQPTPTTSHHAVVIRARRAESVGHPPTTVHPLADATGGALTTVRVAPPKGADDARLAHHVGAAELFSLQRRKPQGGKGTR